ncbi:hypothetical protein [Parasphingorhabdus pacifica]
MVAEEDDPELPEEDPESDEPEEPEPEPAESEPDEPELLDESEPLELLELFELPDSVFVELDRLSVR